MGLCICSTLQFSGFSSSRFPLEPTYTEVSVTIASRMASMGGFVTWAKSCLKYENSGWCFSESTARGVSTPMLRAKALGRIVAAHCEDKALVRGGCIHDGKYAKAHGLPGIPSESEWRQAERDLRLARETGCAYHVCHVSAKESVDLIRRAKADGADVTWRTWTPWAYTPVTPSWSHPARLSPTRNTICSGTAPCGSSAR